MSSSDDPDLKQRDDPDLKRRKVTKACDNCRQKKIRCDAAEKAGPTKPCSNCEHKYLECTFVGRPRTDLAPKGYVEALEARCNQLEAVIRRLLPEFDLEGLIGPVLDRDAFRHRGPVVGKSHKPVASEPQDTKTASSNATPIMAPKSPPPTAPDSPQLFHSFLLSHESLPKEATTPYDPLPEQTWEPDWLDDAGVTDFDALQSEMFLLGLRANFAKRFHGKSSGLALIQMALNYRDGALANQPVVGSAFALRPQYWTRSPWEEWPQIMPPLRQIQFPPEHLADILVDACFRGAVGLYPFIHRPCFERGRKGRLYLTDANFAKMMLLVCAVGSRNVEDARTCYKNRKGEVLWNSAGWAYFKQAGPFKASYITPTTLSELQCCVLASLFLQSCGEPHSAWTVSAVGLKMCQDVGVHRQKVYVSEHPLERELWKRAFWVLYVQDVFLSLNMGRPVSISADDFDVELPLEVDDEYYDEAKGEWAQPSGEPSRITAICEIIKLAQIDARLIGTIYGINKGNSQRNEEWKRGILAEFDSSLNKWQEEVPAHLRWDSSLATSPFWQHSACLHIIFLATQLAVHRPFALGSASNSASISLPSLTICVHASRAICRTLEAYMARKLPPITVTHMAGFSAGIILSFSVWISSKTGIRLDVQRHIEDIERVKKVFLQCERLWPAAGVFVDVLTIMMPGGPSTAMTDPSNKRRDRDENPLVANLLGSAQVPGHLMAPDLGRVEAGPGVMQQQSPLPILYSDGPNSANIWHSLMNDTFAMEPGLLQQVPVWAPTEDFNVFFAGSQTAPTNIDTIEPSWLGASLPDTGGLDWMSGELNAPID